MKFVPGGPVDNKSALAISNKPQSFFPGGL